VRDVLPPNVQTEVNGQSREFRAAGQSLAFIFLLALVFIFLVLAAQFESFRDPVIILLTVPLSMTGALGALYLAGRYIERVLPDRSRHPRRPHHQARYLDRRVRQPAEGKDKEICRFGPLHCQSELLSA
jgi:protein-S-isoprenylcysteine O-methyltransferase Ste14